MAGIAMAGDGDDRKKAKVIADIDEDELFELDIALLDGRGDGCGDRGRRSAAAAGDDDPDISPKLNAFRIPGSSIENQREKPPT